MSYTGKFISRRRRQAIYMRDLGCCVWCTAPIETEQRTLDHVTPRAHGGTDSTRNLVTACLTCNSARGAKTLLQFARETGRRHSLDWRNVIVRVLSACDTPILRAPTVRECKRVNGQISMVLAEGQLR